MIWKYCRLVFVIFVFFLLGYVVFVLKFGGFIEIKRWLKRKIDNKICIIFFIIRSCYFDDGLYGLRVMVFYFGILLVFLFINIIVIFGLYIFVIKIIYRIFFLNKNYGNRVSWMLDGDILIFLKEIYSISVEKIKMLEIF